MMVVRPALVALAAANGMQTAVLMVCCKFAPRVAAAAHGRAEGLAADLQSPSRLVQPAGRVALGGCGCRMLQYEERICACDCQAAALREWHAVYVFRRGMCMFCPLRICWSAGSRRTHV